MTSDRPKHVTEEDQPYRPWLVARMARRTTRDEFRELAAKATPIELVDALWRLRELLYSAKRERDEAERESDDMVTTHPGLKAVGRAPRIPD